MVTTTSLGLGRKLALGLACCALAACGSMDDSVAAGAGGTGQAGASGGAAGSGMAGSPSGGGGNNAGGAGNGMGGAPTGPGGSPGTGGAPTGSGGAGASGAGGAPGGAGGAAGGMGGAGGTAGGGGGAAGGGGGTPDCTGAAFCDGFERAMLGADWMIDNSKPANIVEVVTDKAHTGTNSVHMKFDTSATATFIDETKGFPAMNNSYWGRVWLFVMTGLESGHHVYIEGSTGVNPGNTGVRALNTQGAGKLATNIAPPDSGSTSTVNMPQGVWTCFEWQVTATGANGTVHLYMNGTEVPGTAANGPIPNFVKQRVGYERYSAGAVGELWIDDYAIGSARIPCGAVK